MSGQRPGARKRRLQERGKSPIMVGMNVPEGGDDMERPLRSGYTTGTCAAAAAKAAAWLLCGEKEKKYCRIPTRKGKEAQLPVEYVGKTEAGVCFGVKKDAGDDPDVTDGTLICAAVKKASGRPDPFWYASEDYPGIYIDGGKGVGRVRKPGLSCPVGCAAINPVPREMIWEAVDEVREKTGWKEPLLVTVEIPAGEELAGKTFNPKLGIEGGLSVLGTTGIVEPMSEDALTATIRLELHMKAVEGADYLIVTPGNYGETFLKEQMGISLDQGVKCSNFIEDTMRFMAEEGFRRGMLVGHVGKLIKAAGGVGNTHSRYGDRRMEILWDCVEKAVPEIADDENFKRQILAANTTEEALEYLQERGIRRQTGDWAAGRLREQIRSWTGGVLDMDVIMFSAGLGVFGEAIR